VYRRRVITSIQRRTPSTARTTLRRRPAAHLTSISMWVHELFGLEGECRFFAAPMNTHSSIRHDSHFSPYSPQRDSRRRIVGARRRFRISREHAFRENDYDNIRRASGELRPLATRARGDANRPCSDAPLWSTASSTKTAFLFPADRHSSSYRWTASCLREGRFEK
jgi:hypothetical protein